MPKTKSEKAAYDRLYYQKNKAHKDAVNLAWAAAHPEKRAKYRHKWYEAHPFEARMYLHARRTKTQGLKILKEEIHNWYTRICGICNTLVEDSYELDHIIPLSRGGEHSASNLQVAHPVCNHRKHNNV